MTITHGADDDMEKQMLRLEQEMAVMREDLAFIRETLVKADTTITKVAAEVMPTLDGLMKSPMLKMLMPKGGK